MNPTVDRTLDWNAIADRILDGGEITEDEALAVLHAITVESLKLGWAAASFSSSPSKITSSGMRLP